MLLFYFPILHEENECILIVYMIFILTYELYSTNDVLHLKRQCLIFLDEDFFSNI